MLIMVTLGYKNTHILCNTHWFSTTPMIHVRTSMLRYKCVACRIYIMNNGGPRIAPWGNPCFNVPQSENKIFLCPSVDSWYITYCSMSCTLCRPFIWTLHPTSSYNRYTLAGIIVGPLYHKL